MVDESPLVFPTDYPIKVVGRSEASLRSRIDAVFHAHVADLTAARIREVYGVTEEEFAEEAALAVGATPHQLAVA